MRVFATCHFITNLTLRILNDQTALRALHENDEGNNDGNHDKKHQDNKRRQRALATQFKRADQRTRKFCDNTGKNNQRNSVTNTASSYLLTEPHQENCATNECNNSADFKENSRINNNTLSPFQPNGNPETLHRCQYNRTIARILVNLFPTLFPTFFFEMLKMRHSRC